jgi:CRP-like cAMP-binding protein
VIADAMFLKHFKRNEQIIKYGDIAEQFFILEKGEVEVTSYAVGTDPKNPELDSKIESLQFLCENKAFGELNLLHSEKAKTSVRATEETTAWALEGKVFKQIITKFTVKKRNTDLQLLDKAGIF